MVLTRTAALLEQISERCGRTLAWLTLAMVLTTFLIVLLRYVFKIGWIGLQESVNYMHSMVFMLGAAYAYKHAAHVRVDIFYCKFTRRQKAWTDLIGNILLLTPMCLYIFWSSLDAVSMSWQIKEASQETGGLPFVYLLKTIIPAMAILLLLQATADSLRQIVVLQDSDFDEGGH